MKIIRVPISKCEPWEKNPRGITKKDFERLKKQIRELGVYKPLIACIENGKYIILGGNMRIRALMELGHTEVDVSVVEAKTEEEKIKYSLSDNDRAGYYEEEKLAELVFPYIGTLELDDFKVDVGSAVDLKSILEDFGPEFDEKADITPDIDDSPPKTKPGQIFQLGRHRLMCGDSGKTEDVDRLINGADIHLVNTDPPYNVKLEPRSNSAVYIAQLSNDIKHKKNPKLKKVPDKIQVRPKDRCLEGDYKSDDDFNQLLRLWFRQIGRVLLPGHAFYIWGGYSNIENYPAALKENGLYYSQTIIWVKEHPVLTRKDYMGNHEWCFYGWKEGAAHRFFGPKNAGDVWSVKKISPQKMIHLTEKPVELARRAIEYSSKKGENVLDLFGGSGSTLIAAEELNRNCFMMEIDPKYCDVIIKRFSEFAGIPEEIRKTRQAAK